MEKSPAFAATSATSAALDGRGRGPLEHAVALAREDALVDPDLPSAERVVKKSGRWGSLAAAAAVAPFSLVPRVWALMLSMVRVPRRDQPKVRRDPVPDRHLHYVPGDQISGRNRPPAASRSNDHCFPGLVFSERLERSLGVGLGRDAHGGIGHQDQSDHARLHQARPAPELAVGPRDQQVDHGRGDEDADEEVVELREQPAPERGRGLRGELVGPVEGAGGEDLGVGESEARVDVEALEDLELRGWGGGESVMAVVRRERMR